MKKNTENHQMYFKGNPKVDLLHFTSADTCAFFREADARAHAASLAKKGGKCDVYPVTRDEAFAETAPASAGSNTAPVADAPAAGSLEVVVTQDDLNNNPELKAADVKVGETIEIPLDAIVKLTPGEQLAEAQARLETATAGGNEDEINAAKKAVSTAKARVTREANKNVG
jgi:hypothetical protein